MWCNCYYKEDRRREIVLLNHQMEAVSTEEEKRRCKGKREVLTILGNYGGDQGRGITN